MKIKALALIICYIVLLVVITACSSGANSTPVATSNVDGATLLQERCTQCHSLSRVEGKRYSAGEWKSVIDVMVEKGARVTPGEEPVIINYLAAKYGN